MLKMLKMQYDCDYNQPARTCWNKGAVVWFHSAVEETMYPEVVELLHVFITLPLALLRPISFFAPLAVLHHRSFTLTVK